MPIIRVKHDKSNPYVQILRSNLQRPDLTFRARGLYAYLLSLPDSWEIRVAHLVQASPDGRHAVRSALSELKEKGFVVTQHKKDENGMFAGKELIFYETPPQQDDDSISEGNGAYKSDRNDRFSDGPKNGTSENRPLYNKHVLDNKYKREKEVPSFGSGTNGKASLSERKPENDHPFRHIDDGPEENLMAIDDTTPTNRWLKAYQSHRHPTSPHPFAGMPDHQIIDARARVDGIVADYGEDLSQKLLRDVFSCKQKPVSVMQAVLYCQKKYESDHKQDPSRVMSRHVITTPKDGECYDLPRQHYSPNNQTRKFIMSPAD